MSGSFLHPIQFGIPSQKIVAELPEKKKEMAFLIPKKRFEKRETYVYDDEDKYYQDYRDSVFARTKKKAGWDCMRHYEILAQGCIPIFEDLESCPKTTMTLLPKENLLEAKRLFEKNTKSDAFETIAKELLEYTRNHLTCKQMALRVLKDSGCSGAQRVLVLSGLRRGGFCPDYMRELLVHGLKAHLGSGCHEVPRIPWIYDDYSQDIRKLYGKGFTYTKNVSHVLRDNALDETLVDDIEHRRYDLIIYGNYHGGMPMIGTIMKHYPPEKVILICGDDIHSCDYQTHLDKGHHVFVRELA